VKEFQDALKEYASELGLDEGELNVAMVIAGLEDNPYFSGNPDLYKQLQGAFTNKNVELFKVLLNSAINTQSGPAVNPNNISDTEMLELGISPEQIGQLRALDVDDDAPLRLTETGEEVRQESYFDNVAWNEIINLYATPNEILAFQQYLYDSGVVEEGYFAGTEGQQSEKLHNKITEIMNYIDNNIVTTPEIVAAIRQEQPVYFTSVQQSQQDASFERNLFNYGLKEFIRTGLAEEEFQRGLSEKQQAMRFVPPSESALDDYTESYFYARLGRKPTQDELDIWSTNLANSYSSAYAQAIASQRAFDDASFVQDNVSSNNMISTATGPDLSQFSAQSQEEIFEEDFETKMQAEIDLFEAGQRKKDYQNQLLSVMFGGS
jgi:hypothetical protein